LITSRRRSSKKPSHTFITSNKGKNLLVIDDYIYNHTKITSNVWTFVETLKKEEVVSRQLMLPRSNSVRQNRSVPLNSDDFFTTGFRSRFRRTGSDQFPSVPSISNEFLVEILRNLPELFRQNLDRNPVVKKLSEFNGADRKSTESIGSVAGKQRKQPVPSVGTVDLGTV
jgi:hypothetical protein